MCMSELWLIYQKKYQNELKIESLIMWCTFVVLTVLILYICGIYYPESVLSLNCECEYENFIEVENYDYNQDGLFIVAYNLLLYFIEFIYYNYKAFLLIVLALIFSIAFSINFLKKHHIEKSILGLKKIIMFIWNSPKKFLIIILVIILVYLLLRQTGKVLVIGLFGQCNYLTLFLAILLISTPLSYINNIILKSINQWRGKNILRKEDYYLFNDNVVNNITLYRFIVIGGICWCGFNYSSYLWSILLLLYEELKPTPILCDSIDGDIGVDNPSIANRQTVNRGPSANYNEERDNLITRPILRGTNVILTNNYVNTASLRDYGATLGNTYNDTVNRFLVFVGLNPVVDRPINRELIPDIVEGGYNRNINPLLLHVNNPTPSSHLYIEEWNMRRDYAMELAASNTKAVMVANHQGNGEFIVPINNGGPGSNTAIWDAVKWLQENRRPHLNLIHKLDIGTFTFNIEKILWEGSFFEDLDKGIYVCFIIEHPKAQFHRFSYKPIRNGEVYSQILHTIEKEKNTIQKEDLERRSLCIVVE